VERASAVDYLRDQYGTSDKLDIRIEAHKRYSEQPDDFLDWVIDRLDPQAGDSLIDVGCGRGSYHPRLVTRGVRLIVAIDQSPGMVAETQRQADEHRYPVVSIQGSAARLPSGDDSYDLGMANHMLFHVPDVVAALRELQRVLRPGGRAVLTTAGAESSRRLEQLHRAAAGRLGYRPVGRVIDRFNLDHLNVVREVFPDADRFVRDDAFVFPSTEVTLRYYASGMIDAIADPPFDGSHRSRLLPLVAEQVESAISRDGVFRDPKPAGCFVVQKRARRTR
jgi:ubiquinone/menaquinone biosynthesis C-methylase UbiE